VVTVLDIQQTINRAADHLRAGRLADAEILFRQVLVEKPNYPDALHLLGCTASKMNRPMEAAELMRRAIAADPRQSVFHNNLGLTLLVLGKIQEATEEFRAAIALRPDSLDSYGHLGNALCDLGRFDEALPCYQRTVNAQPSHAQYHYNLGNCWMRKGMAMRLDADPSNPQAATAHRAEVLEQAVSCFKRALALQPGYPQAANNLGNTLQALARPLEAITAWQGAAASGQNAFAFYNLGRALYEQDRVDEALAAMQAGLRLRPDHAESYTNLGNVFRQTGNVQEAIACFDRAIALSKDRSVPHSNRLYTLYYHPDYDERRILQEHQKWNEQLAVPLRSDAPHDNDRSPGRRLRIGYVSPNFWGHCQMLFTMPLFSRHDHQEFEIYCYSDVKTPDSYTAKLRAGADVWRSTVGMDNQQLAQLIRQDRIDVLVDLTLHMAENRLLLFALKPAPVQVTWLGYPGTTGLQTMDYRLTDPYLDPEGQTDAAYTEQSIRLPHTFWCIDPEVLESADTPAVNPLPALTAGHITFGCLNNFCKINQPLLELWARVLDAVPGSRMVILAPPGSRRQWVCQTLGDRVEFVSRQTRLDYLKFYNSIDLGLDTLPYNGHTTSLDSLWMGVPVVTLVGRTVVGRAGISQLSNIGLSDLAATTPEQFIQLAAKLAADLPRLAELRRTLRDRTRSSPLMDAARFARDIESAYRQMWVRWCK
jgi:predicted O-linked N-acetylglucosamine transferase (SPINDLY family)